MRPQGLPRWTRIRRRADFLLAYSDGRKVSCAAFALFARANGLPDSRLGVTATRKFGKSVQRNRAKRLVREAFRAERESLPEGHDYVVVVRRPLLETPVAEIGANLRRLAQRASGAR